MPNPRHRTGDKRKATVGRILEAAYPDGTAILGSGDLFDLLLYGPDLDLSLTEERALLELWDTEPGLKLDVLRRRKENLAGPYPRYDDEPWIARLVASREKAPR